MFGYFFWVALLISGFTGVAVKYDRGEMERPAVEQVTAPDSESDPMCCDAGAPVPPR